jgi:cytoplasmic iron level regulating protein YaaA (DUF328/UPF0246 family)
MAVAGQALIDSGVRGGTRTSPSIRGMDKTLFLISCSDHKKSGGEPYLSSALTVADHLKDVTKQELFNTRRRVRSWIADRRLVDKEKKQGNRATDPRNRKLTKGPDFGESAGNASYLRACQRYEGRFFQDEIETSWDGAWKTGTWTVILSGLYGFVLPHEPIQNYSCHFADRVDTDVNALLSLWQRVLTDMLLQLIETLKPDRVVDLLSEETYQEAVDWGHLYNKVNVTWFHRCFQLKAGPETLVNLGRFFSEEVLSGKEPTFCFSHNKFISRPYFDDPHERILFEEQLKGTSKQVAREGLKSADSTLRRRFSKVWDRLDDTTKDFLRNSEYLYERSKDLRDFDFAHASIGSARLSNTGSTARSWNPWRAQIHNLRAYAGCCSNKGLQDARA